MKLSDPIKAIIHEFVRLYPIPVGLAGAEHEANVRQWSTELCQQIVFFRPNEGWGKKRADPGRPISKDAVARQVGDALLSWDILTGTGTGKPVLVLDPDSEDITGQIFVRVNPVDRMDGWVPSSVPSQPSPLPSTPQYWGDEVSRNAFGALIVALLHDYNRAGNPIDTGIGVWLGRTMFDVMMLKEPVASALNRHRAEWCAILGVPVDSFTL